MPTKKRRTDKLKLPMPFEEALEAIIKTGPPPEDPARAEERAQADRDTDDEDSTPGD